MVIGTTLMQLDGSPYYSPQFNRGGNAATFAAEMLLFSGGAGIYLLIDVQHKNADDTAWTTNVSFAHLNATGVFTVNASAIKEQVRFKYTVVGSAATDAMHFNMLAPAWRPY